MQKIVCLILLSFILVPFNVSAQWFTQQSGTSDLLHSIQFMDINNGWVTNLDGIKLFHTTNGGMDWYVQKDFGTSTIWNFTFINDSTGYFYTREPGNLFKSTDGGSNWQLIHTFGATLDDVKWYDENTGWCVYFFMLTGSLIKTTNGGANWQGFDYFNSFDGLFGKVGIINENSVIVPGLYFSGGSVLFKTTDGGTTWTEIPYTQGLIGGRIQFVNDNTGWIESSWELYKTTDGGFNWELQVTPIRDFYFINENIGWYINGNQIKKSTNGGLTWISQNSGTNNTLYRISFVDQNYGWISGDNGTILHTINGGTPVELISFTAEASGNNVNLKWSTATETNNEGFEIERSQKSNPPAGRAGVKSQNKWEPLGFVEGNGTTTETISYSFIDKNPTPGNYQYRLKQIDFDGSFEYSNAVEAALNAPGEFSLAQNYPNPFNPATTVSFDIGKSSFVTLKVYDVQGNEVATLVNEEETAGSYTVKFSALGGSASGGDGSDLSSGIYFYQFKAGSYTATKKLILLK